MSSLPIARDRLQPALLDRLTDLAPLETSPEPPELRSVNRARLRQSVLRDLSWLLNAHKGLTDEELERHPILAGSTVNFGIAPMAGELASGVEVYDVEQMLRRAIQAFEPRILPESLVVKGVIVDSTLELHNVISFEISGKLWSQPFPLELLLKTDVDLESGAARVSEMVQTAKSEGG